MLTVLLVVSPAVLPASVSALLPSAALSLARLAARHAALQSARDAAHMCSRSYSRDARSEIAAPVSSLCRHLHYATEDGFAQARASLVLLATGGLLAKVGHLIRRVGGTVGG